MNPGFVCAGDPKSLRTAIGRRGAAKVADTQEHVSHPSKKCGELLMNVIVNWLPHDDKRNSRDLARRLSNQPKLALAGNMLSVRSRFAILRMHAVN